MKAKMGAMYDNIRKLNRRIGNIAIESVKDSEDDYTYKRLVTLKPIRIINDLTPSPANLLEEEWSRFCERISRNVSNTSYHTANIVKENPRFWWCNDNTYNKNSPFKVIRKRLLEFAGNEVCISRVEGSYSILDELLLEFGQLWFCNRNHLTPISDSAIDEEDDFYIYNLEAELIDEMDDNYLICYGYFLSKDGIWRSTNFYYNKETNELIDFSRYNRAVCFYGFAFDKANKPL